MADFFVVVPIFNEERGLPATLRALARQSDRAFSLVLVDNGSTDESVAVARSFAHSSCELPVHILQEPHKGTGAASDTGFRYAIAAGARWIARTDADCIPDVEWVRMLRRALADEGLETQWRVSAKLHRARARRSCAVRTGAHADVARGVSPRHRGIQLGQAGWTLESTLE